MQNKILIIDDDPQIHKLLKTVLVPPNYLVSSSLNATEALELVQKDLPDLVLLDIMMPDMSGIEFCQKVRGNPSLQNMLILMLSAKDTQNDRLKGLQYGADDYVTKPFHVSSLVRKIEHMLKKREN